MSEKTSYGVYTIELLLWHMKEAEDWYMVATKSYNDDIATFYARQYNDLEEELIKRGYFKD